MAKIPAKRLAAILLSLTIVQTLPAAEKKKLIEFGWDEPSTAFLRTNAAAMAASPFDGCVFHAEYQQVSGPKGSFTWEAWSAKQFTEEDLRQAFDDLRSTRFGKFKENFLRFNTAPANLDWFDDHTAVLANAKLAARLARAGHCPGLLFDIEQYNSPLFNYRKQRDAKGKGWEIYASQARKRGAETMHAFQEGYPGLVVFLTFGYSLPWTESYAGKGSLADCNYGLLAPFLDGMIEAAKGRTRIVDGCELAYGYKTAPQFAATSKAVKLDVLPIVRDPRKYAQVISLGFGVWMDNDWRKHGWNVEDLSKNYFSPDAFAASVRSALDAADEYVWIYTEKPRWWSAEGKSVDLPPSYEAALRQARGH